MEYLFSGMINASKATIEEYVKILLLGSIESKQGQLEVVIEHKNARMVENGVFSTFNPVSFGPGVEINENEIVKKFDNSSSNNIDKLKVEIRQLAAEKEVIYKEVEEQKIVLGQIRENSQIDELTQIEISQGKLELIEEIKCYENEFQKLEEELRLVEEINNRLVDAL